MKDTNPALYKLIKTTNHNVIIRKDGTKKIAVLLGSSYKVLTKDEIENRGLCIKISTKMRPTKYVAGTFKMAIEAAKEVLENEEVAPASKG